MAEVATQERSWLRRNRWWLLALPVALALALASAAYRVNDLWYENGWHHAMVTVKQGRVVTTRHTVHSLDRKPASVALRVRLGRVSSTHHLQDDLGYGRPMPAGAVGVKVRLDFEAVKGKPAPYCEVYLIDTDGNRYVVEPVDGGSNPCPPPGGSPDDPTAPKRWSRFSAAPVPKNAVLKELWIGVSWPDYVRVRLAHPEQRASAIR